MALPRTRSPPTTRTMPKNKTKIPFNVTVYPSRTLILRNQVADGEYDGRPFKVSHHIGTGALIVQFGDGEWYVIEVGEFVTAIGDHIIETEGHNV